MSLIIGFGHRARQGKNTAAMAVMKSLPLSADVWLASFGDALRNEVRVAMANMGGPYGLVDGFKAAGLMPDWVRVEDGKPRTILQWWGTDYRRSQDPDYWVKKLMRKIAEGQPEIVLITDVRFPNEADAIKAAGGFVVRVNRLGTPDVSVPEHASESALDGYTGWDCCVDARSVEELSAKAVAFYQQVAKGR